MYCLTTESEKRKKEAIKLCEEKGWKIDYISDWSWFYFISSEDWDTLRDFFKDFGLVSIVHEPKV